MNALNRRDPFILFVGDVAILYASLWLTLLIRYREIPSQALWNTLIAPFSLIFIVWFLVLFIGGLYEKRNIILKSNLLSTLLKIQITNSVIAVLFFYFIPGYGLAPKTILFIYLVVSCAGMLVWRIYGYRFLSPKRKYNALLLAHGAEMTELMQEINNQAHYNLAFVGSYDISASDHQDVYNGLMTKRYSQDVSVVVVDFRNTAVLSLLASLYNLIFSGIIFIDIHAMYEDVFNRIPISLVTYDWFLEHVSQAPKITYDFFKRLMDIVISLCGGIISLIVYPFIIIAIKLDDGGSIFFTQERVGKSSSVIKIVKFRSMSEVSHKVDVTNDSGARVSRVGRFLRLTRLDELPQLWNVLKGDVSLIGPRPELPALVSLYEKEIPYYGIRHIITPGLSGWAQIYHDNHPHHGVGVEQTQEKLSYDLYYLKNRSFLLDVKIALMTIKKLLSRSGI